MSSYVTVPDSNARLTDGTVVMLQRFPGTKWIVHNGWYSYNGRRYSGWYFSSIPAQTTMPMNPYDLQGIVVVSSSSSEYTIDPDIPVPDYDEFDPNPIPGPMPGPYPPRPPKPVPPVPPGPIPPAPKPVIFTRDDLKTLNSAFITVENLREFDALETRHFPDGKLVCVNSVDGVRKYFRWNKRDDRWDEIDPIAIIDDEVEYILEGKNYATVDYVDSSISDAKQEISISINELNDRIEQNSESISSIEAQISDIIQTEADDVQGLASDIADLDSQLNELKIVVAEHATDTGAELEGIKARLDTIEDSIYDVQKLVELLGTNTILVSDNGGIADSGVAIGDEIIEEDVEHADDKTVATEKAVVDLVERSQTRWNSF